MPRADTGYEVATPERVNLEYDVAGVGSRGAAIVVDSVLQTALAGVIVAAAVAFLAATGLGWQLTGAAPGGASAAAFVVVAITVVGLFAVSFGYFMLFEIAWNGQTPGKRLVGLRVMRENGYPIRAADAVIRNLVRIVDSLPWLYLLGLVVMLCNDRSKRLGDFAAGTVVVREGSTGGFRPPAGPLPDGHAVAAALRAEDATLIRDYLLRRSTMQPRHRAPVAARLASAMAARYGLEAERAAAGDEAFLERLA